MSLIALALRISAVQALRGKTIAGDKIFDSSISAIEQLTGTQGSGAIAWIYTDADKIEQIGFGNVALSGTRHLCMTFDCAFANKIELTAAGASIEIGETDAAREAMLDLFVRDIFWTLQSDSGPFAECWRLLKGEIRDIHSKRGAGADKGVKFASREIEVMLDAADDPPFQAALGDDWQFILDTFRSIRDLRPIADLIEARLRAPSDLPDWRIQQAMLGLTAAATEAVGIAAADQNPHPLPEGVCDD